MPMFVSVVCGVLYVTVRCDRGALQRPRAPSAFVLHKLRLVREGIQNYNVVEGGGGDASVVLQCHTAPLFSSRTTL